MKNRISYREFDINGLCIDEWDTGYDYTLRQAMEVLRNDGYTPLILGRRDNARKLHRVWSNGAVNAYIIGK